VISGLLFAPFWATDFAAAMIAPHTQIPCQRFGRAFRHRRDWSTRCQAIFRPSMRRIPAPVYHAGGACQSLIFYI